MAQYQSKTHIVEARQYDQDVPLVVHHDDQGTMTARKGDWLIGNAKGRIFVLSDADFQAKFEPVTSETDQLTAANAQIQSLSGQIKSLEGSNADLASQVQQLQADKDAISAKVGDTEALKAQVAELQSKLDADAAAKAAAESKLDAITSSVKRAHDAQTQLNALEAAVNRELGQ